MGANAGRETQAIYTRCSQVQRARSTAIPTKQIIDRRSSPSPRAFAPPAAFDPARSQGELRERNVSIEAKQFDFVGSSASSNQAPEPRLFPEPKDLMSFTEVGVASSRPAPMVSSYPGYDMSSPNGGYAVDAYTPLKLQDEDTVAGRENSSAGRENSSVAGREDSSQSAKQRRQAGVRGATKNPCSEKMLKWHDDWVGAVDDGELDIYTCLGLSDLSTFSADTQRVISKVVGVCVLQLIIPVILLKVQLQQGFSYQPKRSGMDFRIMGGCLYMYSLYSMYNNALDECRSKLLQWSIDQEVPAGYWVPMMVGEVTNVFVSLILVLTLFVIFVSTEAPTDLILNAVAVNFLGAVDGEFVDSEMRADALKNFDKLFYEYGSDADQAKAKEENFWHTAISVALNAMLAFIVVSGVTLSVVFVFAPSPPHVEPGKVTLRHHADPSTMGNSAYPKLI